MVHQGEHRLSDPVHAVDSDSNGVRANNCDDSANQKVNEFEAFHLENSINVPSVSSSDSLGFGRGLRSVAAFREIARQVRSISPFHQLDGLQRMHEVIRNEAELIVLPCKLNGPAGF
jgi:hypothetical protein